MSKLLTASMLVMLSSISLVAQARKSVLPSTAPTASAPGQKLSDFADKAEAQAAYASNNFVYYEPTHLGGAYRNPVDGVTKKVFPLEGDMIMKMRIFGNGFRWVVIKKGTPCRYNIGLDGQPFAVPYAHHLCGNDIADAVYPPAKVATSVAPVRVDQTPVIVQAPAPEVVVQVPAPKVTVVPAPPTFVQPPAAAFGPTRTSVLPAPQIGAFQPAPQPFVPEKKWSVGKKWCVGIGVAGGLVGIYSLLHKDKKAEPKRAVVTD